MSVSAFIQNSFVLLKQLWRSRKFRNLTVTIVGAILILLLLVIRPPSEFPQKTILTVRENSTVNQVAQYLETQGAIDSPFLFKGFVKLFNPKHGVLTGDYYFEKPADIVTLSFRLARGKFGLQPEIFTVPEGSNIFQIAEIAANTFPSFNKAEFISLAKAKEGYLFPDTYHFLPNITPADMIQTMEENFFKKIKLVEKDIVEFGKPLHDVIIMASYLEEEARLMQTRRIVAGILWKRLQIEMPLQVDSTFQYVNGKNTYQLTLSDLAIDSPYNTYQYKGLTPTAISNPGLDSIKAAVTPIGTKYFYFLSDDSGEMHYAVTHDEHVANKDRYLR